MVDVIDVGEYLSQEIPSQTERNDCLAGTMGDHLATEYIEDQFRELDLEPSRQEIQFMGWKPNSRPELTLNYGGEEHDIRAVNMF